MKNKNTKITLSQVEKTIRKAEIICGISAEFSAGKIYGLKGYNGSGKTMLMRLMAGLILPTKGEVRINDQILGKDLTFPESMGILIENPSFLDSYTGYQNLKILADIKGKISKKEIQETLLLVGLDPDDKRKYRKYSLGMKQRLGIAAAVMEDNDILLIDEPTNALDVDGVEMFKQVLNQEKAEGALVLIACHEMNVLRELSDEIYTIEKGRFTEYVNLQEEQEVK